MKCKDCKVTHPNNCYISESYAQDECPRCKEQISSLFFPGPECPYRKIRELTNKIILEKEMNDI